MKNIILSIFLVTLANGIKSQNDKSIYDTVILATAKADTYLHTKIGNFCTGDYNKPIPFKSKLFVIGTKNCDNYRYYSVIFHSELFYVDTSSIITKYPNLYDFLNKEPKDNIGKRIAESFKADSSIKEIEKIPVLKKLYNPNGISILKFNIYDESEVTNGTSMEISVFNSSKKAIKYVWLNVVGFNAVNDPVIDPIKKTASLTFRGVGPIEVSAKATYTFEYAWFTDLVKTAKIKSIKIQFMDNTIKSITNIPNITITDDEYKRFIEGMFENE